MKIPLITISLLGFACMIILSESCLSINNHEFQYNGHPVHPLLIKELLPNPETNSSIGCINLDTLTNYDNIEIVNDSSTINSGIWFLSYFSNTGYIDYHLVSVYKKFYCIIVRDIDGSFPQAYVCFLSLQNKKLCVDGYIEVQNLRDNLITISGDYLNIGNTKHLINTIIHSSKNLK